MKLYAIMDLKSSPASESMTFEPFLASCDSDAVRFAAQLMFSSSSYAQFPNDFDLYFLHDVDKIVDIKCENKRVCGLSEIIKSYNISQREVKIEGKGDDSVEILY